MKVFISVDIEGIAGIVDRTQWKEGELNYQIARELMVGEANAAIEGALAAGAEEIVVNDSHSSMTNINPLQLHPAARLVLGRMKPMSMCQGLGPGFDAAVFVGYHAGRGTQFGVLEHTYTSAFYEVRINGRSAAEAVLNGLLAGSYGVPLVFLSGDQTATAQIREWNPKIHTVVVKEGLARQAAISVHPQVARERIRKGVEQALAHRNEIGLLKLDPPFELVCDLEWTQMADLCERIPGLARTGPRQVRYVTQDYPTCFKAFLTIMTLAVSAS